MQQRPEGDSCNSTLNKQRSSAEEVSGCVLWQCMIAVPLQAKETQQLSKILLSSFTQAQITECFFLLKIMQFSSLQVSAPAFAIEEKKFTALWSFPSNPKRVESTYTMKFCMSVCQSFRHHFKGASVLPTFSEL